jgi:hypothetical protein
MKNKIILSFLSIAALIASNANAAIIASDDFSASGSGTGWASSTDWGTGNVSDGTYSATTENFRDFAATTSSADGSEIWVSVEISLSASTQGSWGGISFFDNVGEKVLFGRDSNNAFWGIDAAPENYSTIAATANQTFHLLGLIEYNSGVDTISLWIDPTDMNNLGTANASTTDTLGAFTKLRLGTGIGSDPGLTVDNLTIGTTFADVIPEPSSAALLLGLGAVALVLRRRK